LDVVDFNQFFPVQFPHHGLPATKNARRGMSVKTHKNAISFSVAGGYSARTIGGTKLATVRRISTIDRAKVQPIVP
jgi:hypothetical protein